MNKPLQPVIFSQHIYLLINAIIEAIILFRKIHYLSILGTKINLNQNK